MAKSTFFKDFKAFITKGNVIDMAVGVVIGGSFSKIVTGLVNYIINPFVGLFIKGSSLSSWKTVISEAVLNPETGAVQTPEVAFLWGTWIQTIIDFLITALCIFIVLRIIMKAKNAMEAKKNEEAAAKAAEEQAKKDAEAAAAKAKADEEAAALKAKQDQLEACVFNQEKLLSEILDALKNK